MDYIYFYSYLFTDSSGYFYENEIKNLIEYGLELRNLFKKLSISLIPDDNILLNKVNKIFPFLFKDNYLSFNKDSMNINVIELIFKVIYYKILIYKNKQNTLLFQNKDYSNIRFKLKIVLFKNNRDKFIIDYNKIYLIVTYDKRYKDKSYKDINYFKLKTFKVKKDYKLSRRTRNIIDKFLLKETGKFIKDFYTNLNIDFNNIGEDIFNSFDILDNLNINEILNEVIPDNRFFESKFLPNIKHEQIDFMSSEYLGKDFDKEDIFIPIRFDF